MDRPKINDTLELQVHGTHFIVRFLGIFQKSLLWELYDENGNAKGHIHIENNKVYLQSLSLQHTKCIKKVIDFCALYSAMNKPQLIEVARIASHQ